MTNVTFYFANFFLGGSSILEVLQKEFPEENLNQYISFHALRNYGKHTFILIFFFVFP